MNNTLPKVPIGPTTVLGVGTGVSAFVAAIVAFILGDRSEKTVGAIVGGAVGAVLLAITFIGRYVQSWLLVKHHIRLQVSNAAAGEMQASSHRIVNAVTADLEHMLAEQTKTILSAPVLIPKLADPALDDPEHDENEPPLSEDDLAGRHAGSELVGHGEADMRGPEDGGPAVTEDEPAPLEQTDPVLAAVVDAGSDTLAIDKITPASTVTAGTMTTPSGTAQ